MQSTLTIERSNRGGLLPRITKGTKLLLGFIWINAMPSISNDNPGHVQSSRAGGSMDWGLDVNIDCWCLSVKAVPNQLSERFNRALLDVLPEMILARLGSVPMP